MSEAPSSVHLTFLCILLLPFVGVTEWQALERAWGEGGRRIPPGCLGDSWPSALITKGGDVGSVDPDFKESQLFVSYET